MIIFWTDTLIEQWNNFKGKQEIYNNYIKLNLKKEGIKKQSMMKMVKLSEIIEIPTGLEKNIKKLIKLKIFGTDYKPELFNFLYLK